MAREINNLRLQIVYIEKKKNRINRINFENSDNILNAP